MIALLFTLLAGAHQAPSAPLSPPQIDSALTRDPSTLPRAAPGHWNGWKPSDTVPVELAAEFGSALRAYQDADYGAALAGMHAVLARAPDFPAALYQCGATYFRLRRYGDGARVFERFVEVVPEEIGATQALGHCYYSLGEYERARAHYVAVLARTESSVEAWRGLGLAQWKLGDAPRALESLDRALALRPDHADALMWRAQVLFELGRSGEALLAAVRARELTPHEPRAWYVEAQVLADLGRDEDATRARNRFLELNRIEQEIRTQEGLLLHEPRALEPLLRLVVLQRAAGNRAETKAVMLRTLRTAPNELRVHALALEIFAGLDERALVERTVTEIETRFARSPAAWRLLAEHHRAASQPERAAEAEKRAGELERGS